MHWLVETPATGRECDQEEMGPKFDGGPKMIKEKELPKTQSDTKASTHSHNHMFPPSCTPHAYTSDPDTQHEDKQQSNPIHTLCSQVQVPIPQRDKQPPDPGGGPLHSGVQTDRLPYPPGQSRVGTAQTRTTLNPSPNDPFPSRGGHKQ
ncbi:hypothetical protein ATANTOWER_000226 [Ataeniobius toweri]|uniref:Prolactin receptor n=1 Tax=Ataeniobius toweri TaxID=208326 RepID=A0ABU7BD28_9TELE|nr:hypothetical protein [Ataeniobius toweri]